MTNRFRSCIRAVVVMTLVAALGATAFGQPKKPNPAGKVFVSDVSGDAVIHTGGKIVELAKGSVFPAQGAIIETGKPRSSAPQDKTFLSLVYSNGTGAVLDADARIEVRRFVQEPFSPSRSDMNTEPSISQMHIYVARGTVALSTSKLVPGSTVVYETPHSVAHIRGPKTVIEVTGERTRVAMLEGESTVRGGPLDLGTQTVRAGEQVVIADQGSAQPHAIVVVRIPPPELVTLEEKVILADQAKRTVYFETREVARTSAPGEVSIAGTGAGSTTSDTTETPSSGGAVTAFFGDSSTSEPGKTNRSTTTIREIVPVPVAPAQLPVHQAVSLATIITRPSGG